MSFAEIEFSPRTLPDGDPIEVMKDYVGRELIRLDIDLPEADARLDYRLGLHVSPSAQWGHWSTVPVVYERSADLLDDGNDDVMAAIVDGPIVMRAPGVEDFVVEKGQMLLFSQARRFQYALPRTTRGWSIRLPHSLVKALTPDIGEAPLRAIAADAPGLILLKSYLRATALERFEAPDICDMAGRHLKDLVALAIRGRERRPPEALQGAVSVARRRAIEADMLAHLHMPDLDLAWIAARQGVSPRHVQRLFEAEGRSFSEVLRALRLEKAAAMLADRRHDHRTVLSIAMDAGFADAPGFNRSFKRHFGFTPGELRPRR
ncbi:MAG: helix-turn-helix transcriptional regulator [Micropepsaceae bacterium]